MCRHATAATTLPCIGLWKIDTYRPTPLSSVSSLFLPPNTKQPRRFLTNNQVIAAVFICSAACFDRAYIRVDNMHSHLRGCCCCLLLDDGHAGNSHSNSQSHSMAYDQVRPRQVQCPRRIMASMKSVRTHGRWVLVVAQAFLPFRHRTALRIPSPLLPESRHFKTIPRARMCGKVAREEASELTKPLPVGYLYNLLNINWLRTAHLVAK